jgi:hypothetical protein
VTIDAVNAILVAAAAAAAAAVVVVVVVVAMMNVEVAEKDETHMLLVHDAVRSLKDVNACAGADIVNAVKVVLAIEA